MRAISLLAALALGACAGAASPPGPAPAGDCEFTCRVQVSNPNAYAVAIVYMQGRTPRLLDYVPAESSRLLTVPVKEAGTVHLAAGTSLMPASGTLSGGGLERRNVVLRPGHPATFTLRRQASLRWANRGG